MQFLQDKNEFLENENTGKEEEMEKLRQVITKQESDNEKHCLKGAMNEVISTLTRNEKESENTLVMKKLNQRQVQYHKKEEEKDMKIQCSLLSNVAMCCNKMF